MNRLILFLYLGIALISCQRNLEQQLTIATAANSEFAIKEIARAFEKEVGINCQLVSSSSGKLMAQIKEGAPYDVFISANMKYPLELHKEKLTVAKPEIYAYGKLVIWTMVEGLELGLDQLTSAEVKHIAIANPILAPFGIAAMQMLKHNGLDLMLQDKFVYGESISQTNQFIFSRTADLGFTAKSVVLSPHLAGKGSWQEVDQTTYEPIAQGAVVIKHDNKSSSPAQSFYDFLFSDIAKKILIEYGYEVE